jgi:hypothetical protein
MNKYIQHRCIGPLLSGGILFAIAASGISGGAVDAPQYQSVQTLTQGGVFPVNGLAGDAFGQVVALNNEFLFVSSPGSQPNNKRISGAVFIYRRNDGQFQQTQVITTGGTGDHLCMLQMLTEDDWLVLSTIGTPVGPQPNDGVEDQDFRGAVHIYRLNRSSGQWEWNQTLDSTVPGLSDLNSIANGGIPVLGTEQGANFGLRMALDAPHGWLFVSALYQSRLNSQNEPVINAGKVYAFELNPSSGQWELAQSLENPDGAIINDAFGAAVAVKGRVAMIGNGTVFQGPHAGNAAVYVYALDHGTWSYTQRLTGTQQTVTPVFFPQFSPDTIGVGDAFGNAIVLSENYALISAPLETPDLGGNVFTGAAYFFKRKNVGGTDRWTLSQRIESDNPNSLAFGVFSLALSENTALIGDIGWSGPAGSFQRAVHVFQRPAHAWEEVATLTDPAGSPSAAFGAGLAIGQDGQLAIGSSPFLGFFIPVVFRPPPAAARPIAPGKVIVYNLTSEE